MHGFCAIRTIIFVVTHYNVVIYYFGCCYDYHHWYYKHIMEMQWPSGLLGATVFSLC